MQVLGRLLRVDIISPKSATVTRPYLFPILENSDQIFGFLVLFLAAGGGGGVVFF